MERGSLASRLAAWGLLGLIIVGVIGGVLLPFLGAHQSRSAQIDQAQGRLVRFAAEEEKLRQLAELQAAGGGAALEEDPVILAASETAAAGQLQNLADQAFRSHDMVIDRIQFPQREGADGLNVLALSFSAKGTNEGLLKALYALETQTPFVFVESLEIRAPAMAAAAQDDPSSAEITASVTLFAYWQSPES